MMTGGTLFSGIGAPECAAPGIDWRWAAEIDPFACAVHAARFPHIPNLGNVTGVDWHAVEPVDLVVGGPPCQAYSVAGNRGSLDDPRGDLTLRYARILDAIDPAWSVTENVPGWLSTPDDAFGAFLGILVGHDAPLVPGRGQRWTDAGVVSGAKRTAAWRICDAQFWGVPQRRRRVFVVACRGSGNWACAEALFPLRESLRRDTAPGKEARQAVAGSLGSGSPRSGKRLGRREAAANHILPTIAPGAHPGGITGREAENGLLIAFDWNNSAGGPNSEDAYMTLGSRREPAIAYGIRSDAARNGTALTPSADAEGRVRLRDPGFNVYEDTAPTLDRTAHAVAFHQNVRSEVRITEVMGALNAGGGKPGQGYPAVQSGMSVRRLLPVECERLQGFHDGWTDVPYRGKPAADGPRYRAIGNSMAVPVIGWVLQRVQQIAAASLEEAA
jgi:DNA (cytosine-5)-methyltransferase 1